MHTLRSNLLLLGLLLGAVACAPQEVFPEERFTKIFDTQQFDAQYRPLAVDVSLEGYLVLAGRKLTDADFTGISLISADLEGDFVKAADLPNNYVAPSSPMVSTSAGLQFICLDQNTFTTQLVTVDDATGEAGTPVTIGGLGYPLASAPANNGNLLTLSYNAQREQTVVAEVTPTGSIVRSQGFSIGAGNDVLAAILAHFTREGSELPFFVGQTPEGTIYFNGFYNFTLSLVFTDLNTNMPQGVVQGQQTNAGLLCAYPLGGSAFGMASFNFNERFIQGRVQWDETDVSSTVNYESNSVLELDLNSSVQAMGYEGHTLFAGHTRDQQIVLYAYQQEDGALVGTQYFGFGLPYHFGGMAQTGDGGLILVGSAYVADRFERIALIKLSPLDLRQLLGETVTDE